MAGVAAALLGCAKPRPARPQLLHDAMVARVEMVAEDLGQYDRERRPRPAGSTSPPYLSALHGRTPSKTDSDWWQGGARGATHYVVLEELFHGAPYGRGSGGRSPTTIIRTFDAQGERAGSLDTRSVAPGEAVVEVAADWDDARLRVGVWIRTESAGYIGLMDPSSARFDPIARVDDVAEDSRPAWILWRGNALLVCYEAEGANVVVEAETESGDARRVLVEERWDPSLTAIETPCLSPDGRFLAFERVRSPAAMAAGGKCSGIWLLDLDSGKCVELTYEDTSDYHHRLLGWGSADTLLFTRRVEEETPAASQSDYLRPVYRAYLALPGAG
jgi:hypothetical protein